MGGRLWRAARCTDLRPYTCIHVLTNCSRLSVTIAKANEQRPTFWHFVRFRREGEDLQRMPSMFGTPRSTNLRRLRFDDEATIYEIGHGAKARKRPIAEVAA
jgi:hypothetical protein